MGARPRMRRSTGRSSRPSSWRRWRQNSLRLRSARLKARTCGPCYLGQRINADFAQGERNRLASHLLTAETSRVLVSGADRGGPRSLLAIRHVLSADPQGNHRLGQPGRMALRRMVSNPRDRSRPCVSCCVIDVGAMEGALSDRLGPVATPVRYDARTIFGTVAVRRPGICR